MNNIAKAESREQWGRSVVLSARDRSPLLLTQDVFGVDVAALTMQQTVDHCRNLVRARIPSQHVVLNAAKVVAMNEDRELAQIIGSCSLINADGMSIVWASKLLGRGLPERVAGIDLFMELVASAAVDGDAIFLLGAEEEVVQRCRVLLEEKHPALRVAGVHNGFWKSDADVIEMVRASKADYLFLAIPSPKKEFWLRENLVALGVPFVMGVGGSFDVLAGKTSRAPKVLQKFGLEWTWRLRQEPRRMVKRYFVGNTKFLVLVGKALIAQRFRRAM